MKFSAIFCFYKKLPFYFRNQKIFDKLLKNAVKLILIFYTGSTKLSDIFTVAEWTKRVLPGFVNHVNIKLIAYSDFYVCY